MDYDLDYQLRLNLQTEFSSLYSWAIQEISADGTPVSRELIPWSWSLYFDAIGLKYSFQINKEKKYGRGEGFDQIGGAFLTSEVISGSLKPQARRRSASHYSFFGTKRSIPEFDLRITRCSDDAAEICHLWGNVSYTGEFDFENVTYPDCVSINLTLSLENFEKLKLRISSQSLDSVQLRLNGVSGFYSDWSPSIRTDHIKILANIIDQKLEFPEHSRIETPVLGHVEEFSLTIVDVIQFENAKPHNSSIRRDGPFDGDDDEEKYSTGASDKPDLPASELPLFDLRTKRKLLRAIHSIAIAAWFMVAIGIYNFIFRHS